MNAAITPTVFNDSLELRAKSLRFRGVGNPYAFLDGIGIIPIKEFLFRGANIIDIADALNLPLTLIHLWIENNNYGPEIEEASVISAEGYIYQGEKALKGAQNKFELDKAKAMLEHGRFMASKKNKPVYGNQVDIGAGPVGVTYVFNVGQPAPQVLEARSVSIIPQPVEAEFKEVTLSLTEEFNLGPPPPYLAPTESVPQSKPASKEYLPKPNPPKAEILSEKDKWNL